MRTVAAVEVAVGYAVGPSGNGVGYARLHGPDANQLIRVPFRVRKAGTSESTIPYAALNAVARSLQRRGVRNVRFVVGDSRFADEVMGARSVDETLAVAYVRLRCALNSLVNFTVQHGVVDELTQRARAEAALNVAA